MKQTSELIFDTVEKKLDLQWQLMDSLDAKASTIIGFTGVIIAVAVAVFPKVARWLFIPGIGLLFVSIIFSICAYKTLVFRRDPDPRKLKEKYFKTSIGPVTEILIDNLIVSYEHNSDKLKRKAQWINYSFGSALVGLFLIVLSVFIQAGGVK